MRQVTSICFGIFFLSTAWFIGGMALVVLWDAPWQVKIVCGPVTAGFCAALSICAIGSFRDISESLGDE